MGLSPDDSDYQYCFPKYRKTWVRVDADWLGEPCRPNPADTTVIIDTTIVSHTRANMPVPPGGFSYPGASSSLR